MDAKTTNRIKELPPEFWKKNKGITDYVLADKLKCSVSILRIVRKKLGVRDPIAILGNRFEAKHGHGSFIKLKSMFEDPLVSLQNVGEYFHFTRAQAGLFFNSIYNKPYKGCFPNRQKNRRVAIYKNRVYGVYREALLILKKRFKKATLVRFENSSFRLTVNGFTIVARRLYDAKNKKHEYMHTSCTAREDDADFFLCFSKKRTYIVPHNEMTIGGMSVPIKHKNGKYKEFINNWDVLKRRR